MTPQGPVAREIAALWWLMLGLGTVVFALVVALLVAGLRRRDGGTHRGPERSSRWLVAGGVVLPVVVIGVVLAATIRSMDRRSDDASAATLTVEVTGHRWWWEVDYPDHGVVTANEVHIPAGVDVELRLRSADVIHSFWVPALAGKKDLLPEATTSLVVNADEPGRYRGQCAEFCGIQHANMAVVVVAHDASGFDEWIRARRAPAHEPSAPAARRGMDLFMSAGCGGCHTVAGTDASGTVGPDLTHVASRGSIGAGTLPLTTPNLIAWVTDPHDAKTGVAMEPADLDDAEIADVVAYLESLR